MKGLRRSTEVFIAAVMTIVAASCERKTTVTESEYSVALQSEAPGVVSGTVTAPKAAPQKKILPDAVRKVCGEELIDHSLEVSPEGGLANAVVWIADAPPDEGKPGEVLIDQKHCEYSPPVAVAHTKSKVKFRNSDALLHNVRAEPHLFNVGMPIENQIVEREMPATEGPVNLFCDLHTWMRADVMVLSHSQWAITDAAGKFRIEHVGGGTHSVRVWHPKLGDKTASVDVKN
jgi:hypothetical protein